MRLNLGAGGQRAEGWTSLDRAGDVDVVHDLTDLPLPFDDDSCEGVVAHHVFDLIPEEAIEPLLLDVRRILRDGGGLRLSFADVHAALDAALVGDLDWFPEPRVTIEESLGWFITQGGARKTPLSQRRVLELLEKAGFTSIVSECGFVLGDDWLTQLDSRESESFFVEAW